MVMQTREDDIYLIPDWTDEKNTLVLNNNGKVLSEIEVESQKYVKIQIASDVLKKDIRDALGIDRRLVTFNGNSKERYYYLEQESLITIEKTQNEIKFLVTFPVKQLPKLEKVINQWQKILYSGDLVWIDENIQQFFTSSNNKFCYCLFLKPNSEDIKSLLSVVEKLDAFHVAILNGSDKNGNEIQFSQDYFCDLALLIKAIERNPLIKSIDINFLIPYFDLDQFKCLVTPKIFKKIIYHLPADNPLCKLLIVSVVLTKDIFDYLLYAPEYKDILSQCQPGKQFTPQTCAAYSVMKYLYKNNLITEFSALKEMEIYQEICIEYGGQADPNKMKKYLESFGVELTLVIDKKITEKIMNNVKDSKEKYLYTKSIFDKQHRIKSGVTEETFASGTTMLMIVNDGNHMMIAERKLNGKIVLQDASFPYKSIYADIKTLNNYHDEKKSAYPTMQNFSGIAFRLFCQKMPEIEEKSSIGSLKVLSSK